MSYSHELSIVIPIHNEAKILTPSITGLVDGLDPVLQSYEILLAENGSTDNTMEEIHTLEDNYPQLRHLRLGQANYGRALKEGIRKACGQFVMCDEIDLVDLDFYRVALKLLRSRQAQMVIGSKLAEGALDDRPAVRHLASVTLNALLRYSLGFKGTDTHGLKAFVREPLLPVLESCVVDKNLFASEFVIRAERAGVHLLEIPLQIKEKRRPGIHLANRVPRALFDLAKLIWILRGHGKIL
jgi:glycosyltransferase involved in cell wall biosynthesis